MLTSPQKLWLIEKIVDDKIILRIVSRTSTGAVEVAFDDAGGNFHRQAMLADGKLQTLE